MRAAAAVTRRRFPMARWSFGSARSAADRSTVRARATIAASVSGSPITCIATSSSARSVAGNCSAARAGWTGTPRRNLRRIRPRFTDAMSPSAAWRPCAGNCGAVVPRGRCPACTLTAGRRRRAARRFDYSALWWRRWRVQWIAELLNDHGILPFCGARMPGGPALVTPCQQLGMKTGASSDRTSLHFHHQPELTEAEATNRMAICDRLRIVLCCRSCHAVITRGAMHSGEFF
jgi:hypothetical protein